MVNIADPVTQWAFITLVSVVLGTGLLMAVAFFRRWQQVRYVRYVHALQREYRPILATLLSGARSPSGVNALRELPLADLELLLDPLFSKRKIPERCLPFLRALCAELGLIETWQSRLTNGHSTAPESSRDEAYVDLPDRAVMRYMLRAKSIRNLGTLRHQPSWRLLVDALNDRHADIQSVALRSLAALGAPESFSAIQERLHAVAQGKSLSPPLPGLMAAMVNFDLNCVPALLPSLHHPDHQIRMHATEILRAMVLREGAREPGFTLTGELITPQMVELLLAGIAVDTSAEIRACAGEIMVFLVDPRAIPVLGDLLRDHQWFVRLRSVRALAHLRQAVTPLHPNIRECLRDPHWRVREAAIQTLIFLGPEGKHQIYEHFLTSRDTATREQIVEVIERTGLMADLVEEYSAGTKGVGALMVEQLASDAAPLGLSGILRTLNPAIRQRFLERFLPYAEAHMRFLEETPPDAESPVRLQQILEFPPHLAA